MQTFKWLRRVLQSGAAVVGSAVLTALAYSQSLPLQERLPVVPQAEDAPAVGTVIATPISGELHYKWQPMGGDNELKRIEAPAGTTVGWHSLSKAWECLVATRGVEAEVIASTQSLLEEERIGGGTGRGPAG